MFTITFHSFYISYITSNLTLWLCNNLQRCAQAHKERIHCIIEICDLLITASRSRVTGSDPKCAKFIE